MNAPHDMGGRKGDGRVLPEPDGIARPAAEWHRTALALTLAAGGIGAWTIETSRHAREKLPDYARLSYYEKWIAALADLLVAKGLVSRAELASGTADAAPLSPRAFSREKVEPALRRGSPYTRPGPAPAFQPGDAVRTLAPAGNRHVPGGHTRLPAYAAGKTGRILLSHGPHVFPDTNAHGLGECPEPLYTVAFRASDLFDDAESPADEVTLDLWQSYLTRA